MPLSRSLARVSGWSAHEHKTSLCDQPAREAGGGGGGGDGGRGNGGGSGGAHVTLMTR